MNGGDRRLVAGVDEAGRGPLAGPVVVAAVILDPHYSIIGLDDSKRLSAPRREELYVEICASALAWAVAEISVADIDRLNILRATLWGMQQAVNQLERKPHLTLIDGNQAPQLTGEVQTLVGGDGLEPAISAASILAKVTRDRIMCQLHLGYPQFRFDQHKGYSTPDHLLRLDRHGPCEHHRRSFAPVRRLLQQCLI